MVALLQEEDRLATKLPSIQLRSIYTEFTPSVVRYSGEGKKSRKEVRVDKTALALDLVQSLKSLYFPNCTAEVRSYVLFKLPATEDLPGLLPQSQRQRKTIVSHHARSFTTAIIEWTTPPFVRTRSRSRQRTMPTFIFHRDDLEGAMLLSNNNGTQVVVRKGLVNLLSA